MPTLTKAQRMAKKKKPGESAQGWKSKPLVIQMRGSLEWKEWLEELAKFDRSTVSDIVDRAIAAHARTIGFPKSPPER